MVSTGSYQLDFALGGFEEGTSLEIRGQPASGRSTLAHSIARSSLVSEQAWLFITTRDNTYLMGDSDAEDGFVIQHPDSAHEACELLNHALEDGLKEALCGIVIDPVGMMPASYYEGNRGYIGRKARIEGKTLIFVNDLRHVRNDYKPERDLWEIATTAWETRLTRTGRISLTVKAVKGKQFETVKIPLKGNGGLKVDKKLDLLLWAQRQNLVTMRSSFFEYEGQSYGPGYDKAASALSSRLQQDYRR